MGKLQVYEESNRGYKRMSKGYQWWSEIWNKFLEWSWQRKANKQFKNKK